MDPLAQRMLRGEFKNGETVMVDAENGELISATAPRYPPSLAEFNPSPLDSTNLERKPRPAP